MNGLLYDDKGTEGLMREPMWQSTKTMLQEFFSPTCVPTKTLLRDLMTSDLCFKLCSV